MLEFLIFSRNFPRSVRYCIERVDTSLHRISNSPQGVFTNESERVSGRLLAALNFGSTSDILDAGLHSYLDELQRRFNDIGSEIFETYVLMPERVQFQAEAKSTPSALSAWQMEQQQQQQ